MENRKKFDPYKVDVRGLSRKEAKEKRRIAYMRFQAFQDLRSEYRQETGKGKCRRKVHTSASFVKENINSI